MTLPGTDDGGIGMGDGVEAFYSLEIKVVNESNNPSMIFVNVTFDKFHSVS